MGRVVMDTSTLVGAMLRSESNLDVVTQTAQLYEIDTASEAASLSACRDPKDDKFLALAMACEAMVIISSDADLLSLQRWNNIAIISPADFLECAQYEF